MFGGRPVAVGVMALVNAMTITAQNLSFGADNFYRSPDVQIQPITFPTQYHASITANLFYPRNLNRNVETAAIVFFNFYPFNDIETISPRPLLFISGDQAHSREFSENAYGRAAEPKELIWVPGAGHVDLYDRADLIPFDRLTRFFEENFHISPWWKHDTNK
ncbi:hypothetical protein CEP54_012615 [Fusarium duplospermum]|uniref:Uncharacterized protein n=1 Tax=Fusarium duplospermum TaxID=1325734 RepID=A0A428P7M8_9HYPO|nr:hypothetical protein CEP54_012615 [Fusarium duplospermum]